MTASIKSITDYDRACEIRDYVGVIDIRDEYAIVLGDMPLATTVYSRKSGIQIVRAFFMDTDKDIQSLIEDIPDDMLGQEIETLTFDFSEQDIVIFDSAKSCYGTDDDYIEFFTDKGKFKILTYELKPNDRMSLLLHRFVKI